MLETLLLARAVLYDRHARSRTPRHAFTDVQLAAASVRKTGQSLRLAARKLSRFVFTRGAREPRERVGGKA